MYVFDFAVSTLISAKKFGCNLSSVIECDFIENEYVLFLPLPLTDTAISSESLKVRIGIIAPILAVNLVPSSVTMVSIPSSDREKETGIFSMFKSNIIFSPFLLVIVITPVFSSIVQLTISFAESALDNFVVSISINRLSTSFNAKSILFRLVSLTGVLPLGSFSQFIRV